jgi:hypothetical protein
MRDFFLHNFWLKLTSAVLATLIWLTVDATLSKQTIAAYKTGELADDWEGHATSERWFDLAVQVGSNPESWPDLVASPARVKVTIRGERQKMSELDLKDLKAFIDLPERRIEGTAYPVQVLTPPSLHCMRVVPPLVLTRPR